MLQHTPQQHTCEARCRDARHRGDPGGRGPRACHRDALSAARSQRGGGLGRGGRGWGGQTPRAHLQGGTSSGVSWGHRAALTRRPNVRRPCSERRGIRRGVGGCGGGHYCSGRSRDATHRPRRGQQESPLSRPLARSLARPLRLSFPPAAHLTATRTELSSAAPNMPAAARVSAQCRALRAGGGGGDGGGGDGGGDGGEGSAPCSSHVGRLNGKVAARWRGRGR